MIFGDIARALAQLPDPRFRRVMLLGVGLTVGLLVAVTALALGTLQWLSGDTTTLPYIGPVTWVGDVLSWGGLVVMLIASVFLMIPVASAITSFFLDDVAAAVEARHHPGLPDIRPMGFFDGLRETVSFLGLLLAVNAAALLASFFFPPFAPFILYGANGFLLGREYFSLVARRRLDDAGACALRRRHGVEIWVAGVLMAIPLTVPLMNLLVPVLGAATFTHLFHRLAARDGVAV